MNTKESETPTARIGMVSYINVAPIYESWKASVHRNDWQVIEAPPAVLNRKLASGEVDLGFVSSYEYGTRPDRYRILSGLSISANGPVGSVFLFSHLPMDQLDNARVLLSAQSETSVSLVKIILEEYYKVHPQYETGDVLSAKHRDFQAVLAIGDDALRLVDSSVYLYQFDLGDIWKRETGLPFVFSVCAVREEFWAEHPEILAEIHRELLRCRDEGKGANLRSICAMTAPRIPMTEKRCFEYLSAIEYDLGSQKRKALEIFFEHLIRRGDIPKNAVPLRIYANLY